MLNYYKKIFFSNSDKPLIMYCVQEWQNKKTILCINTSPKLIEDWINQTIVIFSLSTIAGFLCHTITIVTSDNVTIVRVSADGIFKQKTSWPAQHDSARDCVTAFIKRR